MQWAEPVHALEEREGQQTHAGGGEGDDRVARDGGPEGGAGEQRQVDERMFDAALSPDEQGQEEQPERERPDRPGVDPVLDEAFDRVDQAEDRHEGQQRPGQVESGSGGVARFGDEEGAGQEQQGHEGQVDQEDRAPGEELQQRATDDRSGDGPSGEGHGPGSDGGGPLPGVGEHHPDQGERGGRQGRPGQSEQGTPDDEEPAGGGEGEQGRGESEQQGAGEQQPTPADPVPEGAHGDQESGQDEAVDVHHPQPLGGGGFEVAGDGGGRDEEHGQVHGDQQCRDEQEEQPDPGTDGRSWGSGGRVHGFYRTYVKIHRQYVRTSKC